MKNNRCYRKNYHYTLESRYSTALLSPRRTLSQLSSAMIVFLHCILPARLINITFSNNFARVKIFAHNIHCTLRVGENHCPRLKCNVNNTSSLFSWFSMFDIFIENFPKFETIDSNCQNTWITALMYSWHDSRQLQIYLQLLGFRIRIIWKVSYKKVPFQSRGWPKILRSGFQLAKRSCRKVQILSSLSVWAWNFYFISLTKLSQTKPRSYYYSILLPNLPKWSCMVNRVHYTWNCSILKASRSVAGTKRSSCQHKRAMEQNVGQQNPA